MDQPIPTIQSPEFLAVAKDIVDFFPVFEKYEHYFPVRADFNSYNEFYNVLRDYEDDNREYLITCLRHIRLDIQNSIMPNPKLTDKSACNHVMEQIDVAMQALRNSPTVTFEDLKKAFGSMMQGRGIYWM